VLASAFAALEVLARFLALELAPKIRVNVIRPGLIDTAAPAEQRGRRTFAWHRVNGPIDPASPIRVGR
jgi:NAD(P)-dependent dehydrogenase (short-subunit alcohol dehydrogenase family)